METENRLMIKTLPLIRAITLCAFALTVAGCDSDPSTDQATTVMPHKNALNKSYDEAQPQDCPVFARELQDACSDVVDRRLDFSCNTYLVQLEMAQQQAGGKLFAVGGDAENEKVASALCRKSLANLRAARDRAEEKPVDNTPWATECDDYLATLQKACFARIADGTHAQHCKQTIQMVQAAVSDKNDGAMACGMGALYFPSEQ